MSRAAEQTSSKDAPPALVADAAGCTNLFEQACGADCRHGSFSAEYLLWWVRRGPLPVPLVAAGTVDTGDPATSSGPLTGPGTAVLFGGALALRTNSGTFRHDDFVVIPELGLKAAYQVNDRLRAFMGYDFIYWSDVVRPGNQIDRNNNVGHVPTSSQFNGSDDPRQPEPLFHRADFWAQGLAFGVELRY